MVLEINNLAKFKADKKSFAQVAKKVLMSENKETETVSLVFVDKLEMQKLNKKYRRKDKPTDVLSFELKEPFGFAHEKEKLLGEIVICPDVVKENAEKYKETQEREMMKVFIHGILHLLGYDHEKSSKQAKIMEEKEKYYLSKL